MHYDCISFTKNRIYQAFWCNFQIGNRIFSLEIMSFFYVTVPVKHPVYHLKDNSETSTRADRQNASDVWTPLDLFIFDDEQNQ